MASAAQAPCAIGLAKMTASGLRMVVRLLSVGWGRFQKDKRYPVTTFQTAQRCDDVQPVRQRVFVPVNVIERPVHLLLILFRRSCAVLPKAGRLKPEFTMHPGDRVTSVSAIGSQ